MNSLRKNILIIGSYLLVFMLPLIYFGNRIYPHMSSKPLFFYGVVNILFGIFLYTIIVDKSYRIQKKTLLYFLSVLGFLVWMTVAGIFAISPTLSWWSSISRGSGLLTLYHCFVFALIIASLIRHEGRAYVHALLKWLITGGFGLAISIWLGTGGFNLSYKFLRTDGGGGMTGNSSVAAAYLIFILGFGAFLLISKNVSRRTKWFTSIAMATILFSPIFVNIYGVFTGGSLLGNARGALLGIIVGCGVTLLWMLALSSNKAVRTLGVIGIIASVLVFSYGWKQLVTPSTTLHTKFTEAASGTRFLFWNSAQEAMNKHPFLGYGPENQMVAFQENFNPKILLDEYNHEGYTDRYHNIYYDIGATGGYPAIILYGLIILSMFFVVFKKYQNGEYTRAQSAVFSGLIIGYIFQNLFFFDSILSLVAFFVLIALIYSSPIVLEKTKNNKNFSGIEDWLKNILACVLIITCGFSWYYLAYRPAQKLVVFGEVFSKQINKPFNKLLEGSLIGEPWDVGELAYSTFKDLYTNATTIKNNKEVLPYILKDLTNFLTYLEQVTKRHPNDLRIQMSMANLYNTYMYLADASQDKELRNHVLAILDHAHELAPRNPEVYWGKAQVYSWSGEFAKIEESYKQAIDLDSSILRSHQYLIQFAQKTGNTKLYKEAITNAQKNIPGFVAK